jgi:methionyl-tRNA formyltransferase
MKQKVVFLGSGDYSIPVIEMLRSHGLELVVTTETEGLLIKYLEEQKIPYLSTKVTEEKTVTKKLVWDKVEQLQPTLGVLASFGAIIPQRVIDVFPKGIWNIHPSLLPKYKGPSPIQTTVLNGDKETGVTIITLDDQIDHGPILAQEHVELTGIETTEQLKHDLFKKGGEMVEQLLTSIECGDELRITPQPETNDPFTEKITKEHGKIILDKVPEKEKLERMIRAFYSWPTVWFTASLYGKIKLIKLLPEGKIQVEGKRVMTYKEFVNGYQEEGKEILEKLGLIEKK